MLTEVFFNDIIKLYIYESMLLTLFVKYNINVNKNNNKELIITILFNLF